MLHRHPAAASDRTGSRLESGRQWKPVADPAFDPVLWQRARDLSAFVLAGGRSARMGRDKAFLELAGRTLL
ncbi:MAG: NTP transferase domain-containing protein, partial [Terriglobales bacterium]